MIISQELIAQMESGDVDRVNDFKIGLSPSRAQYIKIADFAVASLSWFRGESEALGFS